MDLTLIVPYNDGFLDTGCDLSEGIRIYPGKLTLEEILKLTEEPAYARRAVCVKHDKAGAIESVYVTFSNDQDDEPRTVGSYQDEGNLEGTVFEDEHAKGLLTYEAHYNKLGDLADIQTRTEAIERSISHG